MGSWLYAHAVTSSINHQATGISVHIRAREKWADDLSAGKSFFLGRETLTITPLITKPSYVRHTGDTPGQDFSQVT